MFNLRASGWPRLDPEPRYQGHVEITPFSSPPPPDAVWTDGACDDRGGAAAVQLSTGVRFSKHVPQPISSMRCELVALTMVSAFPSPPHVVLTDSLDSLEAIRRWHLQPVKDMLLCSSRVEVRMFLHVAQQLARTPRLVKVKAHKRRWNRSRKHLRNSL
jgi:hypothetical protein